MCAVIVKVTIAIGQYKCNTPMLCGKLQITDARQKYKRSGLNVRQATLLSYVDDVYGDIWKLWTYDQHVSVEQTLT